MRWSLFVVKSCEAERNVTQMSLVNDKRKGEKCKFKTDHTGLETSLGRKESLSVTVLVTSYLPFKLNCNTATFLNHVDEELYLIDRGF